MVRKGNIKKIFQAVGLESPNPGIVLLNSRMEDLEENPYDDWLYLMLSSLRDVSKSFEAKKIACIGTGQSFDQISCSLLFNPEIIYATDVVEDILELSSENLKKNISEQKVDYRCGRDCHPIPEKVDLIVFNPGPLMSDDEEFLSQGFNRAVVTEREIYEVLAENSDDVLLKWSLLPHLGFLLSAKEKLNQNAKTLTTISGRIPFKALEVCYKKAGINLKVIHRIVKKQTNPEFLKQYADYEEKYLKGDKFHFFNYGKAQEILAKRGIKMPGIIDEFSDEELKEILRDAAVGAKEAYELHKKGIKIAHVGYALEGSLTNLNS